MDPDNAVPWLLLAGKARTRRDSTAEAEAFSHAANAQKIDSYSDSVFAFAEPELPADVTPLERSYLATEVMGVEAAVRLPQYSVASQHCSSNAMQDSTVRQQCSSMAELLVTKRWPRNTLITLTTSNATLLGRTSRILRRAPSKRVGIRSLRPAGPHQVVWMGTRARRPPTLLFARSMMRLPLRYICSGRTTRPALRGCQ
jgi:hypothetical protein